MKNFDVRRYFKQQRINEGKEYPPQSKLNYDKVKTTLIDSVSNGNGDMKVSDVMELVDGYLDGVNETDDNQPIFNMTEEELLTDFLNHLETKTDYDVIHPNDETEDNDVLKPKQ